MAVLQQGVSHLMKLREFQLFFYQLKKGKNKNNTYAKICVFPFYFIPIIVFLFLTLQTLASELLDSPHPC